jgi:hypothetical protein
LETRIKQHCLIRALVVSTLLWPATSALGQEVEPQPAEALPPSGDEPTPPAIEADEPTPPAIEAVPESPVIAEPLEAPADVHPDEDAIPAEAPGGVNVFLFADAYYSYNTQAPGTDPPAHRAFDGDNGFTLAWLGMDVTYDGGPIGATASFRLGTANPRFFGGDTSPVFYPLTQAYLTWAPTDKLTLDLGQFYTIYGAEVAESWNNLNYTRGAVYYATQPFWHTGLRANYAFSDAFALNAMVVNGVNQSFVLNHAPALGLQALITPSDAVSLAVGYLHQTDPDSAVLFPSGDRSPFDNFLDVTGSVSIGSLTIVGDFDFNIMQPETEDGDTSSFWGASLALGYAFSDMFGAAVRGEYVSDPDGLLWGTEDGNLMTGTLTFDLKPIGENLVIRWDNRIEHANNDIFFNRDREQTATWFNSVLGVVVKSM